MGLLGAVFGDGEQAGVLGTGQYRVRSRAGYVPGADQVQAEASQGAADVRRRAENGPPEMGAAVVNTRPQEQFRNQQRNLVDSLLATANGTGGPSAAELQLKRGTENNLASALAMASSARGPGQGAALREISSQRGAATTAANADAALLRAQETTAAQGLAGTVVAGARGQDVALASEQAGLVQGARQANLQAGLQFSAQNDAAIQHYLSLGLSAGQAQQAAAADLEALRLNAYQGAATNRIGVGTQIARAGGAALGVPTG